MRVADRGRAAGRPVGQAQLALEPHVVVGRERHRFHRDCDDASCAIDPTTEPRRAFDRRSVGPGLQGLGERVHWVCKGNTVEKGFMP